ncbi:MAG: hypothetical protein FWB85_03695 [Chitinispirillia bacterium]|nr:hypothetical protein [Chitinispirillia bacterium]MCL2241478.1 hypothetical protein [Chitinispirillia bacterium]
MKMKRLFVLVILAGMVLTVQAQQSMRFRGSDGWGVTTITGARYEQLFDNFNLQTVVASVVRVDTATIIRDMGVAVRLIVTLDGTKENIPVHLGPMWFALNQDVNFPAKEKVEIRGYRANFDGTSFIMPVEIRSKNRIFRFRDDDGNPFWGIHRPR